MSLRDPREPCDLEREDEEELTVWAEPFQLPLPRTDGRGGVGMGWEKYMSTWCFRWSFRPGTDTRWGGMVSDLATCASMWAWTFGRRTTRGKVR